jgi:hypothetical protein
VLACTAVKKVFLFSELGESSPMRVALREAGYDLLVRILRGTHLDCPIAVPPDLVVIEPAPHRNIASLVPVLSSHPVVGRVPWLLVLDPERVHAAPRLPCSDFIARGFHAPEAVARCERLLTRQPDRDVLVRSGPIVIDLRGHEARLHGVPLKLPPQEFSLLRHFVQHPNRAWTRETLLDVVWGPDYMGGTRTVDIHVRRLRAKLGASAAEHLETLRQVGYRWVL